MHETPWGSVLDGRVDGVCIMLVFALLKKSAEPPKPFNILEPITQVELACAYISLSLYQLRVIVGPLRNTHTSAGVLNNKFAVSIAYLRVYVEP